MLPAARSHARSCETLRSPAKHRCAGTRAQSERAVIFRRAAGIRRRAGASASMRAPARRRCRRHQSDDRMRLARFLYGARREAELHAEPEHQVVQHQSGCLLEHHNGFRGEVLHRYPVQPGERMSARERDEQRLDEQGLDLQLDIFHRQPQKPDVDLAFSRVRPAAAVSSARAARASPAGNAAANSRITCGSSV